MPTFNELALQGDYPVVHSLRKDQATLIATRVPLTDPLSGRWGWVLTLNHRDGRTDSDDIATLRDNTGRQYPKIYLLADMQNYIEKWGCAEWEEGYHHNGYQPILTRDTVSLDADIVREEILRKLLGELQTHQDGQVAQLIDELAEQLVEARKGIEKNNAECFTTMQDSTMQSYNVLLERTNANHEGTTKQFIGLDQAIAHTTSEVQEQSRLIREEAGQHVKVLTDEIKNTTSLSQKTTLDALDDQSRMAREEARKQLEEARGEIKTDLGTFTTELKALEEQIKLEAVREGLGSQLAGKRLAGEK